MESITIKVENDLANEINKIIKPYYSTKTEFIREAIRHRIKDIKEENARLDLLSKFGKAKTKTPLSEDRKIREKVGKEYFKKYGFKLD
ncbi:MAG: hypothetical protein ISS25_04130 [Nanoarchaeota archaeon]|nr:hypothetical protein [DPANN group archaeon]MBL7116989.1 hypothetical protein [Nanoarchaeota archaeon]